MRTESETTTRTASQQKMLPNVFVLVISWLTIAAIGFTQPPDTYKMFSGTKPPGLIGKQQVKYGRVPAGKTQPVRLSAPKGTLVSSADNGSFSNGYLAPVDFGLQVGEIYRFRLTDIPKLDGVELYPSLEIIGHLSPPQGKEREFPIPVVFALEDLRIASEGGFVTRVIYVEDPDAALPGMVEKGDQAYFEVAESEDPMHVAEVLGRPVAILRIGSKSPDSQGPDHTFTFNSPSLVHYSSGVVSAPLEEDISNHQRSMIRQASANLPRPTSPINSRRAPVQHIRRRTAKPNVGAQPRTKPWSIFSNQ